jgi:hypothetical protein
MAQIIDLLDRHGKLINEEQAPVFSSPAVVTSHLPAFSVAAKRLRAGQAS